MDTAVLAALTATFGFAGGDVFTALLARKVNGKASMLLLTLLKLILYVPFAVMLHEEFSVIDGYTVAWAGVLGALFFVAYWGFNMAFQMGKNPALVGVVAGCFPASAAVVAIVFLGQRPSLITIALLLIVLLGVILIGLPEDWRTSFKIERGVLLAMLPLVCWGIFGALLHEPINHLNTPHAWFVVQTLIAIVMGLGAVALYNRQIPGLVLDTNRKKAWIFVLPAALVIGIAEALQAFSLGSGQQIVIIEALLGGYPAVYFLLAHRIFKDPLRMRQWIGIILVAIAIISLSIGSAT